MGALEFFRSIPSRWRRPDTTGFRDKLVEIANDEYDGAQASGTTFIVADYSRKICKIWRSSGKDGCVELVLEYRRYAQRFGRRAQNCHSLVMTKLGSSPFDLERECWERACEVISEIQGANDRTFLGLIPELVERWDATVPDEQ